MNISLEEPYYCLRPESNLRTFNGRIVTVVSQTENTVTFTLQTSKGEHPVVFMKENFHKHFERMDENYNNTRTIETYKPVER